MTGLVDVTESTRDNDLVQLALSHKHDSKLICWIAEIAPDTFALFQHGTLLFIGDWPTMLWHYRNRPKWEPKPRPPRANGTRRGGKISAADKAANTAKLLALMKGPK